MTNMELHMDELIKDTTTAPQEVVCAVTPTEVMPVGTSRCTSMNIRRFPTKYTIEDLLDLLYKYDYLQSVDFVIVPMHNKSSNLGFATINFTNYEDAIHFKTMFAGFSEWGEKFNSNKKCVLHWTKTNQSQEDLIEHYRDAPIMHELIPSMYKPKIFSNGKEIPFPRPRKPIDAANVKLFSRQI